MILVLQFENLDRLSVRHAGMLAEKFEAQFPDFAVHPPLDPIIEQFDGPRFGQQVSFQLSEVPLFPRIWLVSTSGAEVVQIQRDRLMHNWRRGPNSDATYPRYPSLREAFTKDWETLAGFLREHDLGALLPTQCEVSYVNHIDADSGSGGYRDPANVFSFLSPALAQLSQGSFEVVTHSSTYKVATSSPRGEQLLGRLYAELGSGVTRNRNGRVYQLSLLLRGAPASRDLDGVLEFFDFARERIVKSFADLTTDAMHKEWGANNE